LVLLISLIFDLGKLNFEPLDISLTSLLDFSYSGLLVFFGLTVTFSKELLCFVLELLEFGRVISL
jgi:hypothetical protein